MENNTDTNKNDNFFIAMLKVEQEYYVLTSDDNTSINSWATENEAIYFFTNGYNRSHIRGVQGSSSAIHSFLATSPRVVKANLELLAQKLFNEEEGIRNYKFNGALGYLTGLKCNRPYELVKEVYQSGKSPGL
jgi:hypothetical protein